MKKENSSFLEKFTLGEELSLFEKLPGQPKIFNAFCQETEAEMLLKMWPRQADVEDEDLYLIWRNEMRQLQRLISYPGAREYLLPMTEAGRDTQGYYLVFHSNTRVPYPCLEVPKTTSRLSLKKTNTILIWRNIRRLVKGLGILHSQGLLHRNLNEWSIFTTGSTEPDFQLGGFEWSLRLGVTGVQFALPISDASSSYPFSFRQDWKQLGFLAMQLLGVPPEIISSSTDNYTSSSLLPEERSLLKELTTPSTIDRFDSELVCKRIDEVIEALKIVSGKQSVSLCLIYDHHSHAQKLLNALSGYLPEIMQTYDITSSSDMMDFIGADLIEAELVELKKGNPFKSRFAISGRYLTYFLKEYRNYQWTFATLDNIREKSISSMHTLRSISLDNIINVKSPLEIATHTIKLRNKTEPWDSIFDSYSEGSLLTDEARRYYNALVALHLIEMLQQATMIWYVKVIDVRRFDDINDLYTVVCLSDPSREKLSQALGLDILASRFQDLLEQSQDESEIFWQASEKGKLGQKSLSAQWSFVELDDESEEISCFKFKGKRHFVVDDAIYLRLSDDAGYDELMQRRTNLLLVLKEHSGLLELLNNPLFSATASHDPLPSLSHGKLDQSKQQALREIVNVLPIYFLQGPPGVGKTHLVTELVKQCFDAESSTRMLITAQGHDAVNHLMSKICNEVNLHNNGDKPLIVRSKNRRNTTLENVPSINAQSKIILEKIMTSPIFTNAPLVLKDKIKNLSNKISESEQDVPYVDKSLESLILRSANLVFSTTNAAELERIVSYASNFDWSIIEEAGRATGTELLAPMMLSHRRLLIGDPKQLPPFGEDKIIRLLREPKNLRIALEQVDQLLDRSFNELGVEDLVEQFNESEFAQQAAEDISDMLLLFSSMHEKTFEYRGKLPVSGSLKYQHRMHPAIADMVSTVFYDGKLLTAPECERNFTKAPLFSIVNTKRLPASPIVIFDMPYSQRTEGAFAKEQLPHYHNPSEVDAVMNALAELRVVDINIGRPSLVILSPYNEQIKYLKRRLAKERKNRLAHLNDFILFDDPVQSIDAFQGKEADIVLVSLVRNNARSWTKSLGIVGDARRMNVLFSRAKDKIILVGSLDFLRARFLPGKQVQKEEALYFLKKWISYIDEKKASGEPTVSVVAYKQINEEKK
ncbi:putative DNA helicase [Serratia fonticola]|uniref:AAA domain-containing protein n=1 Tax=Serratia fonticola TaxID=47917 RepID=UPI002183324B|nr:AAA domain-containing protein [Serratia fonticola]CAI2111822.1 putative DNA helicase [Serratia fonticola]